MCQPTAINTIDPDMLPPTISVTIITAVRHHNEPSSPRVAIVGVTEERVIVTPYLHRTGVHTRLRLGAP
jgi:hypothetical protein